MILLPPSKPKASREEVIVHALAVWRESAAVPLPECFVVGVPGYYSRSMGPTAGNDRGIYDDAFFVFGPGGTFVPFNGNVDPSIFRSEIASLKCPQVIWYRKGPHAIGKRTEHPAFRQDSPVVVKRDNLVQPAGYLHRTRGVSLGGGLWTDKGYHSRFWTNNHRGGRSGTSSEGCLTLPPAQWDAYYAIVCRELAEAKQSRFPMILTPVW